MNQNPATQRRERNYKIDYGHHEHYRHDQQEANISCVLDQRQGKRLLLEYKALSIPEPQCS